MYKTRKIMNNIYDRKRHYLTSLQIVKLSFRENNDLHQTILLFQKAVFLDASVFE